MTRLQDRRRRIALTIGVAFVVFALWEAVIHVWRESIPRPALVSLIVETAIVLVIVSVALNMARDRAAEDQARVTRELRRFLQDDLGPRLVTLVSSLRALETRDESELGPDTMEMVHRAVVDGSSVLDLVEELDALAEEAVPTEVTPQRQYGIGVLEEVGRSVRPLAREKGVELVLELTVNLPQPQSRSDKVIELLTGLITNAVAATPTGKQVKVIIRRGKTPGHNEVSVSDAGPAIHKRAAPLGEIRSENLPAEIHRCRMSVDAVGGEMGYEPGPGGEGNVYTVSLPTVEAEQ